MVVFLKAHRLLLHCKHSIITITIINIKVGKINLLLCLVRLHFRDRTAGSVGDGSRDEDELFYTLSSNHNSPVSHLRVYTLVNLRPKLTRLTSTDLPRRSCFGLLCNGDVQKEPVQAFFSRSIESILKFFSRWNPKRYDIELLFFSALSILPTLPSPSILLSQ